MSALSGGPKRASLQADQVFAIGDIHGCAVELVEMLELLPLGPGSTLVTLGDYVDRGPDSRGVLDVLLALEKEITLVALRGNHEQLFLDYLDTHDEQRAAKFVLNGGGATLRSYASGIGSAPYVPNEHIDFLRRLRLSYETDEAFFVHAAVPDVPLDEIDPEVHGRYMIWARNHFLESEFRWDKLIVHGHNRVEDVTLLEHRVNLDTGCAYGGKLSAMGFPSRTLYTVPHRAAARRPESRPTDERRDSRRLPGQLRVWVSHPTVGRVRMTTVDYSSTGLLVEQEDEAPPYPLHALVDGTIEVQDGTTLAFFGQIARRYRTRHRTCYGLSFSDVRTLAAGDSLPDRKR